MSKNRQKMDKSKLWDRKFYLVTFHPLIILNIDNKIIIFNANVKSVIGVINNQCLYPL